MDRGDHAFHKTMTDTKTKIRGPLFVVGCPRSGTTLLQRMLDAHSAVAIAPETHFIRRFWKNRNRYGDLSRDANFAGLVDDILAIPEFPEMHIAAERYRAAAMDGERSYRALFACLLDLFATTRHVPIVGEKTPNHVEYAVTLLEFFPDARFVHIVRDPRAVVNSWRSVPWSTGSLVGDADVWRVSMATVRKYPAWVRDRFHTLTYERLIAFPGVELRQLCAFLGLDFEERMLDYHAGPTPVDIEREPWKTATTQPLDITSATRWRNEMSASMISTIESVTWLEMRRLGYPRQTALPALLGPAARFVVRRWIARER